MRQMIRSLVLFALCFLFVSAAFAGLFDVPEPKLIYEGTAPELADGVLVIRQADDFDRAIVPLDPAFAGPKPDFKKYTILRVVGRARPDGCHETVLSSVSTRNFGATVHLEERVPKEGCRCAGPARPPKAWLVAVARMVRRARVEATDMVVDCEQALSNAEPDGPALLFQGSWDEEPGGRLISDAAAYQQALTRLGAGGRGPEVDFSTHQVIVITGRPRENGCRKTAVIEAQIVEGGEFVATVEERYPGKGQMCTQIFSLPKAFVYRVPKGVGSVRVVTREVR